MTGHHNPFGLSLTPTVLLFEALYAMGWYAKTGTVADLEWALTFYAAYARRVCAEG